MIFLTLVTALFNFYMHAKCKFALVKAISTLGMAKSCPLLGRFRDMVHRENFVKIR